MVLTIACALLSPVGTPFSCSPRFFVRCQAVVSEFYDEVVFTDPFEEFYATLMQGQKLLPQRKHEHQEHFSTFSDGDTLQRLAAAREWVHNQLRGGRWPKSCYCL